jgi:hypothetical protein
MMFCRWIRRHACVLLFAAIACRAGSTSAATTTVHRDSAPFGAFVSTPSDSPFDVRPVEYDPALLPAGTPAPAPVDALPPDGQATVIPLPPAAWTGMAGLLSLGLIRGRHKLRRFLS